MKFKVGCHKEIPLPIWSQIAHTLRLEGGYVNDIADSGGETNFGITHSVAVLFKTYFQNYIDIKGKVWNGSMKTMPKSFAADVYTYKYFYGPKFNLIEDENIQKELFDSGVNCGTVRPVKWLQEILNIFNNKGTHYPDMKVDGYIGKQTVNALTSYTNLRGEEGLIILYNALNTKQGAFYMDLATRREKDEKFVYGWFSNRIDFI